MVRVFIAIDTPSGVRAALTALRDQLRTAGADVRWESDEKLHCTLKFLGDVREEILPSITEALEEIARTTAPCEVLFRNVGCFPDKRNPRIFWVGIEDQQGELGRLQQSIDTSMYQFGVEREERAFLPHITLGRTMGTRNLGSLLTMMETITLTGRKAFLNEIAVVKSDLKPGGSVYTILKSFPLVGKTGPSEYIQ